MADDNVDAPKEAVEAPVEAPQDAPAQDAPQAAPAAAEEDAAAAPAEDAPAAAPQDAPAAPAEVLPTIQELVDSFKKSPDAQIAEAALAQADKTVKLLNPAQAKQVQEAAKTAEKDLAPLAAQIDGYAKQLNDLADKHAGFKDAAAHEVNDLRLDIHRGLDKIRNDLLNLIHKLP